MPPVQITPGMEQGRARRDAKRGSRFLVPYICREGSGSIVELCRLFLPRRARDTQSQVGRNTKTVKRCPGRLDVLFCGGNTTRVHACHHNNRGTCRDTIMSRRCFHQSLPKLTKLKRTRSQTTLPSSSRPHLIFRLGRPSPSRRRREGNRGEPCSSESQDFRTRRRACLTGTYLTRKHTTRYGKKKSAAFSPFPDHSVLLASPLLTHDGHGDSPAEPVRVPAGHPATPRRGRNRRQQGRPLHPLAQPQRASLSPVDSFPGDPPILVFFHDQN